MTAEREERYVRWLAEGRKFLAIYTEPSDWSELFDDLIVPALEEIAISTENRGVDVVAGKLLRIVETGEHVGTFGGEAMERCVQAILALRRERDEARAEAVKYRSALGCKYERDECLALAEEKARKALGEKGGRK